MSRPFVPIVLAVAAGFTTAHYDAVPLLPVIVAGCAGLMLLGFGSFRRAAALATCGALIVFWAAGFLSLQRFDGKSAAETDITRFISGERILIEGIVAEPPACFPDRTRLRLRMLAVHERCATQAATGILQLTIKKTGQDFRYGDRIRCRVAPRLPRNFANPGGFDYVRHCKYHDIHATAFLPDDRGVTVLRRNEGRLLRQVIERMRDRIRRCLDRHLTGDTAAILKALTIGEQEAVPRSLRKDFARLGIAHILAISGLHVGIVALIGYAAVMGLLRRFERVLLRWNASKIATAASAVFVLLYCCVAGFNIPTVRATLMVLCYLAAVLLGRRQDVLHTLFVAAFIILTAMPASLFDVSFQLSFAAVFWIIVLVPAWQRFIPLGAPNPLDPPRPVQRRVLRMLRDAALVSAAAIAGTAPLTAYYFHSFAWAGFIANLAIVPFVGFLIVPAGLAAAALLPFSESAAAVLFTAAGWLTDALRAFVAWCGDIPGITLPIALPSLLTIACIYLLLALTAVRLTRRPFLLSAGVLLFTLVASAIAGAPGRDGKTLTVSFLDVGAGDAAVVEFPNREVMVIDAGGFADSSFDTGESIIAPFLYSRGITSIDYLVLTHPHADHAGGLAHIAEQFSPRELWHTGESSEIEPVQTLIQTALRKGITQRICSQTTPPLIVGGVRIEFLNPPQVVSAYSERSVEETNNDSLVMKITYGGFSVLMAADILQEAEQRLVREEAALAATILKVPHHGGKTSSSDAFLDAVEPQIAVASCKSGGLSQTVAQRYRERGIKLLTTAEHGAVTITSDGRDYTIVTALR